MTSLSYLLYYIKSIFGSSHTMLKSILKQNSLSHTWVCTIFFIMYYIFKIETVKEVSSFWPLPLLFIASYENSKITMWNGRFSIWMQCSFKNNFILLCQPTPLMYTHWDFLSSDRSNHYLTLFGPGGLILAPPVIIVCCTLRDADMNSKLLDNFS